MKETLRLNRDEITEKDVTEAKAFVAQFIPEASEETLQVSDYRTAFLDEHVKQPEKETVRVVQIKEIMAKVKA